MAKISIEEALRTKLALPWKIQDRLNTVFLVIRRRPEDLTKQLFDQLRQYGHGVAQIRELFYINSNDWNKIAENLGIEKGKRARKAGNQVTKEAIKASQAIAESMVKPGKGPRLSETPAEKLPRVSFDSSLAEQRAREITHDKIESCINGTGPMPGPSFAAEIAAQTVAEQIAQATREQVETFFAEPEESVEFTVIDLSGWETFDLAKSFIRPRSLIAGTTKLYIGVGVKFIKDWDRCCVKVRPDGKQIALEKVIDAGYKVGKDHQRPAVTCRAATEMLCKFVGTGAEFLPIIEQESLVVFEHKGK